VIPLTGASPGRGRKGRGCSRMNGPAAPRRRPGRTARPHVPTQMLVLSVRSIASIVGTFSPTQRCAR
jgi:hypothetical protein